MKKFYTSIAIVAIIIIHVTLRFAMADSFAFSSSDYTVEVPKPKLTVPDPVSYSGSNVLPSRTLFINLIPSDNSFVNY